jgi:diguanylate cyclase (GGDEF)-like protein
LLRASTQGKSVAVMFLDLDNFKVVNDSLGHDAGDEMLVEVAKRLITCVRPHDTVARLGGDEFTILLEDIDDPSLASEMAARVARVLNAPVQLKGHEVFTSASIGVAVSTHHELPGDMLRDADTAMYQAKAAGKAHHIVFDPTMKERATERLELESELRRAIDQGELRIHYQPIIALETGNVTEVEALVRWDHPVRGIMPPLRFIPLAEETGLILPLGQWVLEESCRQARAWQKEFPSDPPLTVSVNLSARQFAQADLVNDVARVLKETNLSPCSLKLEITESLMMVNPESTRFKLAALRDIGVRLAVDDFGTGYSSMAYLSRFPLDTLKIDKSFVGGLGEQTEADAIVRAIITLAKTLNLHVTSEGIETAEQLMRLNNLGSDLGQGYFFSRPLTTDAMRELLAYPERVPRLDTALRAA